jgi:predicted phosphate transport protein (TIGR00153 family)
MFNRLIPRDNRFFDLFKKSSELGVLAACQLRDMLLNLPEVENYAKKVKDIEHQADEVTHRAIELLHKTFITPLDRDDIHELITALDDVIDFIEATSQRIFLYDIRQVTPEALSLAEVCIRSVEQITLAVEGVESLEDPDKLKQCCIEINRLENEADQLMRVGIARLFREELDFRQLIKMKELYELLETITDRCEDVANIIEGILLEYA